MKAKIVKYLMSMILENLPEEAVKKILDKMINVVEEHVESTENKIDDALVLPTCAFIRNIFAISDNDK